MSWTQLQYVLISYLANPLWTPLASFVDNCVKAVWIKQLKLRARGQGNIARKPCSDRFYWLYLNPSSFDNSHQHPASAPGHTICFWELFNSDCLAPFPLQKKHILALCSLILWYLQNYFADPKVASEKKHVLVKRFPLCWIRVHCWVALGMWLPSTLRLCKHASHCPSSSAIGYDFGGSTDSEKSWDKKKILFTVKIQSKYLHRPHCCGISATCFLLYLILSVPVFKLPHLMSEESIISIRRLEFGLENWAMYVTQKMTVSLPICNTLPGCATLPLPTCDKYSFHCAV